MLQGETIILSRFRLNDILLATKNFSETYCIGFHPYGKVYKAKIDNSNNSLLAFAEKNDCVLPEIHNNVAIKRIFSKASMQGKQGFFSEIEMPENDEGLAPIARHHFNDGTIKKMIDPKLKEVSNEDVFNSNKGPNQDSLDTFLKIAHHCLGEARAKRPTMKVIIKELEIALNLQENLMKSLQISLEDIKLATKNFSQKNLCESGIYWEAYKGELPHATTNSTIVAKRWYRKFDYHFWTKLDILTKVKHKNILGLVGYCTEMDEKIIVYEHMSKGSLDNYLKDPNLNWMKRLQICIDVSSALEFLYRDSNHPLVPLAKNQYVQGKLDEIVFEDIREQIVPQSLTTFRDIAYQCLHEDEDKRPQESEVVIQLRKALEFQEDSEIWEPKLPRNYREIISLSDSTEIYHTKKKKDLYKKLCNGILFPKEKVWFILTDNGGANKMISAMMFSYENHKQHKWRSIHKSRFGTVAKMLDISNLKIQITTNTQFLSPDVVYAVYLVFKFCDPRIFSCKRMYMNLKYRNETETLNSYFATWRDDEWMMIELYRFLNHEDVTFKFLLDSFSRYYCRSDAIYIEGIEFRAIKKVVHEDIEDLKEVQQLKKSNSDLDHLHQPPTLNEEIFKRSENEDMVEQLFSLSELNGKKRLMLSALKVLYNSPKLKPFCFKSSADSRFNDVVELLPQQVFRIKYKIESHMLSPFTEYTCYLVFKVSEKCQGLHCPVKVRDLFFRKNQENRIIYFRFPAPLNLHDGFWVPEQRKDGWMEVMIWKFNSNIPNSWQLVKPIPATSVLDIQVQQGVLLDKNLKCNKIPLSDIKFITDNFSETYSIGSFRFYSLYRINIKYLDKENSSCIEGNSNVETPAIIKRILPRDDEEGEKAFYAELEALASIKHRNIVTLIGSCVEASEMIFIIETVYLNGVNNGLACVARKSFRMGTIDEMIDPIIKEETDENHFVLDNKDSLHTFIEIAYQCVAETQDQRPTMKVVVQELEKALFYKEDPGPNIAQIVNGLENGLELQWPDEMISDERIQRPNKEQVVHELEQSLELQTRITFKHLEHLKIHLNDITLATDNFSEAYKIGFGDYCALYRAELNHFHKGNPSYEEGKNKDEHHKRHDKVVIKRILPRDDDKGKKVFYTEIEESDKGLAQVARHSFCVGTLEDMIDPVLKEEMSEHNFVLNRGPNKDSLRTYRMIALHCVAETQYERPTMEIVVKRLEKALFFQGRYLPEFIKYKFEEGKHDEVAFKHIREQIVPKSLATFQEIAYQCLHLEREKRPATKRVLSQLKKALEFQEVILCEHIGTMGYLDPAIENTGGVTHKSDIYSFGVVLLEIICGRKAYIENENEDNRFLAPLVKYHYENKTFGDVLNLNPYWYPISPHSFHKYLNIAFSCLNEERELRPGNDYIVDELENAMELQLQLENIENNLEHLKIRLSDIESATNNFSEAYEISSNIYYTWYRGELERYDEENLPSMEKKTEGELFKRCSTVLIKRILHKDDEKREQAFYTEIDMLTSVKHQNIATLVGLCVEESEMILIIENASNGFLTDCLKNANDTHHILTWEKRLKICIDVAHALKYLHYEMEDQKMIINRDICSYNIGLDENWGAKIVNFESAVYLPPNQEDEALHLSSWTGKLHYMDPEYKMTHKLKKESDVYSFGVVLIEILCGRLADDPIYLEESYKGLAHVARESFCMGTLEDMIDPIIKEEIGENRFILNKRSNNDSLHTFIEIAIQCVAETQDQRPSMKVVVQELEKALLFQVNNLKRLKIEHLKIPLSHIKLATNNFSEPYDSVIFEYYRAELNHFDIENHSFMARGTVVIKRYPFEHYLYREKTFFTEIEKLTGMKHPNIVTLHGFCVEGSEMILVIENLSNGCLGDYFDDKEKRRILTWEKRLKICIDVAHALNYLHSEMEDKKIIINRDIHLNNIGLDDNWRAKIVDFWFSVFMSPSQEEEVPYEKSIVYTDPEYGKTAMPLLAKASKIELAKQMTDPLLNQEQAGENNFAQNKGPNKDSWHTFFEITCRCLVETQDQRPTMKVVVEELEKALFFHGMNLEHLKIRLTDIRTATNNFSEIHRIASESFYTCYRATLHLDKENPSSVVIQRITSGQKVYAKEEFVTEMKILTRVKHPNIVTLLGFCVEDSEMILVFENFSNGYLKDYLEKNKKLPILTWEKRLKICIDVAQALNHLHYGMEDQKMMIINYDICSLNIGLDENWGAKIASFHFSALLDQKDEASRIVSKARMSYMDPESTKTCKLKREVEVYSFGVVLLEILCGRPAYDPMYCTEDCKGLVRMARRTLEEIIDPIIEEETGEKNRGTYRDSLQTVFEIANQCVTKTQDQRPTMKDVVKKLKKALFFHVMNLEHMKIRLTDIKFATDNFSEKHQIASNHCYTCYRAELQQYVVIKRISFGDELYQEEHFVREIDVLTSVKHPNIVTLFGFCVEASEMILVIDDVSNGNLNDYLTNNDKRQILTWEKRLKICIDIANALNYLHSEMEDQKMIIIHSMHSYNIWLDKNWRAKIVNFHQSAFLHQNQQDGAPLKRVGPPCCIDPEYKKSGKLKRESDVYSFGVVLFEILCGRLAYDRIYLKESEIGLAHVARQRFSMGTIVEMIDPIINKGANKDSLHTFIKIANQCVAETQDQRPSMKVVANELEKALHFQKDSMPYVIRGR
ncbi:hypothetical protein E3N88_33213 [Mikania micrantha]|uniref:Protein kinase domain-containing protein n=1 Tax=Mikania micrantha TaxID=192012 RepID=A0A5N6MBB7_9ASTR|nr:hypothetical protein E3N88_33213 [Mikania micrantha]